MRKQRPSLLDTLLSRLAPSRLAQQSTPEPAGVPLPKYRALAIFRGAVACDMAKKFSEHRFLAREAPGLPLQGCTMPHKCECRYLKFKDRRRESRRVNDFGAATRYRMTERRHKGRRQTD